jgi:hypothetical protein
MLASITESLYAQGLSLESVTTELQKGADGAPEFVVHADCVATQPMDQTSILAMTSELNDLKHQLLLDVVDVRIQRLSGTVQSRKTGVRNVSPED